jgi:superfamily II DNA or RNA helicase
MMSNDGGKVSMTVEMDMAAVIRELDEHTCDKGFDVRRSGLVRRVDTNADGSRISGSVSGSKRAPYSQSIMLNERNGRLRITGYCTCPMAFNCKHVAAVLIDLIEQRKEERDNPRPVVKDVGRALPAEAPLLWGKAPLADELLAPRALPAQVPRPEQAISGSAVSSPTVSSPAVSIDVISWLDRLGAAAGHAPPSRSPAGRNATPERMLVYILNPEEQPGISQTRAPRLRPVSVKVRKDGGLGDLRYYDPENVNRPREQRARYLLPVDEAVLRDLVWLRRSATSYSDSDIRLGADIGSQRALDGALGTGRLRYGSIQGPVLSAGPVAAAKAEWTKASDGRQRLTFIPSQASETGEALKFDAVLALSPPRYIDLNQGLLGTIESGLPPALALEIALAPAIGLAEAGLVRDLMQRKLTASAAAPPLAAQSVALPLPEAPDNVEVRTFVPTPRLELLLIQAGLKQTHLYYMMPGQQLRQFPLPIARLSFNYGGEIVANASEQVTVEHLEDGRLVLTPRDQHAELAAAERLRKLNLRLLGQSPFSVPPENARDLFLYPPGNPNIYDLLRVFDTPDRFLAFSGEDVRTLVSEGWEIAYADNYPYRLAEGEAQWWADVGEGSGIDWFSFELGIEYEGHRINLVPQLAQMLERLPPEAVQLLKKPDAGPELAEAFKGVTFYHQLADGRMLPLPGDRLVPMLRTLFELIGPRGERLTGGKVKLHRAEAGLLAEIAEGVGRDVAWAASTERLIALGKNLRRGRGLVPVLPPATFKADLRAYQGDGLAWIDFLRESGFGGVLADDMGLGKTVQALAFLAREKAEGRLDKPALIVAPTSVLPNWQAEAERFAPGLKVLALRGLDRKALFAEIPKHDLVLTTYPLLARDHEVLLAEEFHVAILDEAQAIKNPKATVTRLAHRINARHRLALTGTPLENNLGEVWSLFEFLSPGLLGDESTFRRTFRTPIEKHGDQAAQAFLSRRLKPFLLRRTKSEVATELPPKTEIIERIQLEGPQRDLYETVRSLMHEKVRDEIAKKGLAKSHIIFLDALLKLRQICCDPRLLKMPQARKVKGSAKLERLMEMIPEMVAEGRRILLFSQFTSMLALIEDELNALEIPYVQLTGQTTDRSAPVKAFQSGKVPLFLLSLKAGGTGLNLTAADTVIHYDPWWNPAVENQATDRAHRIGQDKPVFVYKLIVEEGIETAIEQLKARKAALADALFAGASKAPLDLTEADISALFAPLSGAPGKKRAA